MKPLDRLVVREGSALPVLLEMASRATNPLRVRPPEPAIGAETLVEMQVSTASPLGAVAYHTGGIAVQDGFVRVLGSAEDRGLRDHNHASGTLEDGYVLVADDVLGGFFAMNHGGFAGPDGAVHYLPPDKLDWADLGADYGDFLHWCMTGDLGAFYAELGWSEFLAGELPEWTGCFAFAPLPWTQGGADLGALSRQSVPVDAVWRAKREFMTLAA